MTGGVLRGLAIAIVSVSSLVAAVTPAAAHIRVLPAEVAPADPALFTVLVPGETASGTSKVTLKVPAGVYPFSYEETPGWKRRLVEKPNGLVDQIIWTGRTVPDGLLRFTFLAGTPEQAGEIRWAAIQTYADGEEARWIGPPDSEHPAAVTVVSDSAPRQNAGGESADQGPTVGASSATEEENNWPLTVAALLGFFFGLSSLVILFVNRKGQGRR